MRRFAFALLALAAAPCLGADREAGNDGPFLLAVGKAYSIHAFNGAVQENSWRSRVVRPGIVVFHTNTRTGQSTWMVRTGTYEIPTRRISYSVSRLLGLLQTDSHIAVATYSAGRVFDQPPRVPPPDVGSYRLAVFEKESGKKQFEIEIVPVPGRPEEVPDETAELGVIQRTSDGFAVLGATFLILNDGSIKPQGAQQAAANARREAAAEK